MALKFKGFPWHHCLPTTICSIAMPATMGINGFGPLVAYLYAAIANPQVEVKTATILPWTRSTWSTR